MADESDDPWPEFTEPDFGRSLEQLPPEQLQRAPEQLLVEAATVAARAEDIAQRVSDAHGQLQAELRAAKQHLSDQRETVAELKGEIKALRSDIDQTRKQVAALEAYPNGLKLWRTAIAGLLTILVSIVGYTALKYMGTVDKLDDRVHELEAGDRVERAKRAVREELEKQAQPTTTVRVSPKGETGSPGTALPDSRGPLAPKP